MAGTRLLLPQSVTREVGILKLASHKHGIGKISLLLFVLSVLNISFWICEFGFVLFVFP